MLLDNLLSHYRELLYLPDETAVLAALATVAAQDIPGPPVWTLLVGPPSSGKTEIIDSLRLVDGAVSLSTLTRASLLSGRAGGAGGLLVTHFGNGRGVLLVKDFTTILSEAAGTRTEIIAVLRETYDGHLTRAVGSRDNLLTWQGKITFLGAVTEEIEQHRNVISLMGDRFLYVPMPSLQLARTHIAKEAIRQAARQAGVRETLARAVRDFFTHQPPVQVTTPDESDVEWLAAAANLAAQARSPVLRDPRSQEIELTPEPESPARLAGELHQLQQGLHRIGSKSGRARSVLRAAVLGSIPKQRRLTLLTLLDSPEPLYPAQIAARTQTPEVSIRRPLEDLAALKIIEHHHPQQGWWANQHWTPTAATRQQWATVAA